jgi:hypothetical protein
MGGKLGLALEKTQMKLKTTIYLLGICIGLVLFLGVLCYHFPRHAYFFMLLPSLGSIIYAFLRRKGRIKTLACIIGLAIIFAIARFDIRVIAYYNRKGVFILPVTYGMTSPFGCVKRGSDPKYALIISI